MTNSNPFKAEGNQQPVLWTPDSPQKAEGVSSDRVALAKQSQVEIMRSKDREMFQDITSFDWKKIPPPVMVEIIKRTPMRGGANEPDYFLADYQAWRFAIRCYEIGLSPLSTEVWYNPRNNMTNVTYEGKQKLSRINQLNLSPPKLERIPVELDKPLVAYKCTIQSPTGPSTYTATLKEWKVGTSPVWRDKAEHMLQLRASEKCLSFAMGLGSSELMGEQDLQIGPEVAAVMPASGVDSTEFVPVSPEVAK
jgi:hypothetical protein